MTSLKRIQNFHIKTKKYNDIAYNFLIGSDGNVYEGRGWKRVGSHTHGFNSKAIGISFVGNFSTKSPKSEAIEACKLLIEWYVLCLKY